MAIGERDPHTGHMTTGHEWNGIKELNAPVPKVVFFFLIVVALFSAIYWLLMPAWPTGLSYTKGLLGIDQRKTVVESLEEAMGERAVWARRLAAADYGAAQADEALMQMVRQAGPRLFGDNCAGCHGADGKGGKGYPNLVQSAWLWGGDAQTIAETLRIGINANHPDTRISLMTAFGRDRVLERADVLQVAAYVQSLSAPKVATVADAAAQGGKAVFDANCTVCHGEDAKGDRAVGAPDLTDRFWIYGGDLQSIYATIYDGRQGQMPSWESRLSPLERKILTLYVLDLRTKAGTKP